MEHVSMGEFQMKMLTTRDIICASQHGMRHAMFCRPTISQVIARQQAEVLLQADVWLCMVQIEKGTDNRFACLLSLHPEQ